MIDIDQSPIGRTPRSNPATYTGAFTPIRDWYAGAAGKQGARLCTGALLVQRQGRALRGLASGDGAVIQIEMHFLPDVYVQCDVCQGKRYNRETLEVKFRGHSIADVLDMTVEAGARAVPGRCRPSSRSLKP